MKYLNAEDKEKVRRTPLFAGLHDDVLDQLLKEGRVREFSRGGMLFMRGEPVSRFFLLLEGWVKVFRDTPEGDQVVVAVMKPGDSFAQAAIFTGRKNFPASAEVVSEARVLEIPADPFMSVLRQEPDLAIKILGALSERLVELVQHIERLQFNSTPQRLAGFLIDLLAEGTTGEATVKLPYDKSLIAARLGMKPESLSRALAKLKRVGVTSSGSEVTIKDVGVLHDFCCLDEDA
ncbi:MAG: cyclic nucleotide-binding domain-containing protein [Rhodospirillales bacterium]|nr:cyclic nucleotide-binding domain-containing protein [Rhodospirillales bacterium]MCW8861173.1 cyclic nucleotide-binding domain-containing protein [Rhodospirillales bacterium]MCW8951164.1 cyclic nucleotide-binding domain-containing protein [Rhodospirillales bacterium]MCW8970966.1 cyclic nucleotide-binding domain-containing protein [Rhodospirillales bacterium]MCW9002644.1 cyclic nucleotide-binding domain-containing protein [Rhodospirillales bacterium]